MRRARGAGCAIYWSERHGQRRCKRVRRRGETLYKYFMFRWLIAILLGISWVGVADLRPRVGQGLRRRFTKLLQMVIAPIISVRWLSAFRIPDARKVVAASASRRWSFEMFDLRADPGIWLSAPDPAGHGLAGQARSGRSQITSAGGSAKVGRFRPQHHSGQRGRRVGARDILQVFLFASCSVLLRASGERGHRLRDIIDDTANACSA